ncbi:MAG: class I SAM-dependent methyltransferase [Victivallales bacterium]|nr:class I SAM-dependent methyltransferase [Victivallales bacterium]
MRCRLCNSVKTVPFYTDHNRSYSKCVNCGLIFALPDSHLSPDEEKKRYDLHTNSPEDQNYRNFLNRIYCPLINYIPENAMGLDFGSGPGPTLSLMFEENGYTMDIFDPFYANNDLVFQKKYNFITLTEVIEHLHNPIFEINRLWKCLNTGGVMGIMTKFAPEGKRFYNWHYIRDLTHVCFYSEKTFNWLAGKLNANVIYPSKDIVLFIKK